MPIIPKRKIVSWTLHARVKMRYYKLSPARVRRVLNSPKRVEEGVAPKTVAMMQPAGTQEIWVMVEDTAKERRVISAWRYPGVTKPRATADFLRKEYNEFINADHEPVVRK